MKITASDKIKASEVQSTDKDSEKQKESQVSTQEQALAKQTSAQIDDATQDAKAAKDKINKELGKIPQKIEDTEDDIIDKLKKFLGSDPSVKKIKVKTPDGFEYNKPDFDPDKALKNLKKTIDPMLDASKPLQSVGGKIPLLGDLVELLTKMSTDTSGETEISEEELYKLMPNQPEIPTAIKEKAGKIVKLTGQAIMYLPIFLIDVIVNMIKAIYDMFKQIQDVIGVPPPIFPLSLIDDLIQLVPKVKKLILQTPPTVEDVVEQKLKKKFHYAAALSVPKPNVGTIKSTTSNSVAKTSLTESSSTQTEVKQIEQSIPPPVQSKIQETPSVPAIEPKAPKAPDTKPTQQKYTLYLKLNKGFYNSTGHITKIPGAISDIYDKLYKKIHQEVSSNTSIVLINSEFSSVGCVTIKIFIPNTSQYSSIDKIGSYYDSIIQWLNEQFDGDYELKKYGEKIDKDKDCSRSYYINETSFLGIF